MTFSEVLTECLRNKPLLKEYDRLRGTNLSLKGSGLDLQIDQATGRLAVELKDFVEFVYEYIYTRIEVKPNDQRKAQGG